MTLMNLNRTGLRALAYTILGFILSLTLLLLAFSFTSLGLLVFILPEFDDELSFKIGLAFLLIFSYFFGNKAKVEIVEKQRNKYLVSYLYGMLTLFAASLAYSVVRLTVRDNCIENDINSISIFFLRPLYIGLLFGFPSILLFGTLFARHASQATRDVSVVSKKTANT